MRGLGFRGFGADPITDASTGVDPTTFAGLTVKDAIGITYWKPEVGQLIVNQLGSLFGGTVTTTQSADGKVTAQAIQLIGQADVQSSATAPTGGSDLYKQALASDQSVLASYGLAVPSTALQKYLFNVPNSIDFLKTTSAVAPVLTLSQSAMVAINAQGGGAPAASSGMSAWWSKQQTVTKVAVVGGVVVVGGFALGLWGKKRRRRSAASVG
jgi:hypothetical protein